MKKKLFVLLPFLVLTSCASTSLKEVSEVFLTDSDSSLLVLNKVSDVNIHTEKQQGYLDEDNFENIGGYAKGVEEFSRPTYTTLSFVDNGTSASTYYVDLSKDETFSEYKRYETSSTDVNVTNLEVATTYYWRVTADSYVSNISSFDTLDNGIRNIYISGVTNARDIGGYLVQNGTKRIRQGAIYRTGEYNNAWSEDVSVRITEQGIKTMREDLKIKSEIDLRRCKDGESSYIQNSVLGEDINYFDCTIGWNSYDFIKVEKEGIKAAFNVLFNINNLPAAFHCAIGTDRTGGVAFILGALLGKSEKECYQDFMFSNFGNIGGSRDKASIDEKIYLLTHRSEPTLQEKAYGVLLDMGFSPSKINNFIEYMLIDA